MSRKYSVSRIAGAFALIHPVLALAQQTQEPPGSPPPPWSWHGPGHMWGMGWGFWWIGPFIMLLIFVACASLIGRSWRGRWGPPWHGMDRTGRDPTSSALQILNERYAKGEIEKQEYEERKATILSSREH
jgi:putative membrane protein